MKRRPGAAAKAVQAQGIPRATVGMGTLRQEMVSLKALSLGVHSLVVLSLESHSLISPAVVCLEVVRLYQQTLRSANRPVPLAPFASTKPV
jgi:hypothetical protein